MTDHAEEQEMEAEALTAIFDQHFSIHNDDTPSWTLDIYPEAMDDNHVACTLVVKLPPDYPESMPDLSIKIIKGLADEHEKELTQLALDEAEANLGVPSIFAVAERLREWLAENNQKGLDDVSMHAQMMRKQQEEKKAKIRAQAKFEAHNEQEEITEAEKEEMAVRKRRAEGTPCNKENFEAWRDAFLQETASQTNTADTESSDAKKKNENRVSGREFFSNKTNNLEALELAAEQAENDEELDDVNEELFDDDVDLDDLDFDDDEDDDDEDDDDEVDI